MNNTLIQRILSAAIVAILTYGTVLIVAAATINLVIK